MTFSDAGILTVASGGAAALFSQVPVAMDPSMPQWGEYGIVGVTVALALWSLRDAQQRRIDDAKEYANDVKQLLSEARSDGSKHHEFQVTLLMRLLERKGE